MEYFEQANQTQIKLGLQQQWARAAGRFIVELLDTSEPLYGVQAAIEVAREDLASGRPLALQIGEESENEQYPEGYLSYNLTTVNPGNGEPGPTFMSVLSTAHPEGTIIPPQELEEVYSDDQMLALEGLLTWQCTHGLLIPARD
jgi:hypothetical protein